MDLPGYRDTFLRAGELIRLARAARQVRRAPEHERDAARRALATLMADARGVPMKIGQFLAGDSATNPFSALTSSIAPLPLEALLTTMESAWERPVHEVLEEIAPIGIAASLGQVHQARLLDGTPVAIKVRYPGISAAVESEMRLAALLPGVGPVRRWGFDLSGYKQTLRDNLHRELDYQSEAVRQRRFYQQAPDGLIVPEPLEAWTTDAVLVQRWQPGVPLTQAATWPLAARRETARILLHTLLHGLFVTGHVHGDPHAGNLRYRHCAGGAVEVILYDYGCTIEVPREARLALLQMILGCQRRQAIVPYDGFVAMGFDAAKLAPIASRLPALCMILFEPFLQSGLYGTQNWALGPRVDALLGELKWWFRAAGPPSLLLLMRAFHGLVSQLETLGVALDWRCALDDALPTALHLEAEAIQPTRHSLASHHFDALAQYLKVLVTDRGDQVVFVTMPANQVIDLETIVPEEVAGKIQSAGINLAAIRQRAVESGIVPQELFRFDSGARTYRVWLE
jgi:hypothetical protein